MSVLPITLPIYGIRLTRNSCTGRCEVSIELDLGNWVPVITDSGEIISHIVEPAGIERARQTHRAQAAA